MKDRLEKNARHAQADNVLFEGAAKATGEPAPADTGSETAVDEATTTDREQEERGRGLSFERRNSRPEVHPFDEVSWELRSATIRAGSAWFTAALSLLFWTRL